MRHLLVPVIQDSISERWEARMRSSIRAADQSCDVTVASFDAPPETCSSYDAMYFAWPDWCLEDVCMNDETVQKWKRRMEETQTIILPSHRGYFRVKEAASRAPVFVGYPYDIGPLKEATEIFDPSAVLEKYPFYESGTFSRTLVEDVRKNFFRLGVKPGSSRSLRHDLIAELRGRISTSTSTPKDAGLTMRSKTLEF